MVVTLIKVTPPVFHEIFSFSIDGTNFNFSARNYRTYSF